MILKNKKGFTIIELLVVVVIIGILSVAIMFATKSSREIARDNQRMSDMQQLHEALGLYMIDEAEYPSAIIPGEPLVGPTSGTTYMAKVPNNPTPWNDGDCLDSDYSYTQDNNGSSYHLKFCLAEAASDVPKGYNHMTPLGFITGAASCDASCDGKTCGDDGCGGSCGSCGSASPTEICSSNSCITDTYTQLMLHMNGSDNGTTFTDYSSNGFTITRSGAVTKTGVKQFGTASGYFDGVNDYLSLADNANYEFGSGDFTIDFWVYIVATQWTGTTRYQPILHKSNGGVGGWAVQGYATNSSDITMRSTLYDNSGAFADLYVGSVDIGGWHHIALVRDADTYKGYIDGVLEKTGTGITGKIVGDNTLLTYVGRSYNPSGTYTNMYLDEVRISKGVQRWTSDFTPPTEEY